MKNRVLKACALACLIAPLNSAAFASASKPPANFQGQWWTHPNGCQYSRAGRPGEVVWFLVVNTARKGCPTYIASKTWGGVYKDEGPKIRR